jgi:AAA domain, putative AbiEii toxin, Type IV TA system
VRQLPGAQHGARWDSTRCAFGTCDTGNLLTSSIPIVHSARVIIDVRLASLRSSGGEILQFPRSGVTCIVGGNNVGKSRLLREIDGELQSIDVRLNAATFSELHVDKSQVDEEMAERFLSQVGVKERRPDGFPQPYRPIFGGQQFSARDFLQHYQSGQSGVPSIRGAKSFFVYHMSAGMLPSVASSAVQQGMEVAGQPLHQVFRDGTIEQELSDLSMKSFGVPLTLDRINEAIRLRVGTVDVPVPPLNRPTREYADAVRTLPSLEEQGDGIKSFLGLALYVLATPFQVMLIDEPEAFLHPSHSRALGRWLAREAVRRDIQVIVATHDRDLLLGLIDAEDSVVNIARITRDGTLNHIHELPHGDVAAAWEDPVLRYSNVLQGLFHRKVCISESDADCRFYGAVLDQLGTDKNRRALASDILFVPSGGKQRVGPMASALARLDVETFAIVDFDILNQKSEIKCVVEGVGGDWTEEMNDAYTQVAKVANQNQLWGGLKNQGLRGLPSGAVNVAGRSLLEDLRKQRVLVVSVGEMEDFDKSIGLHGAEWVSEMLASGNYKWNQEARDMLLPLLT